MIGANRFNHSEQQHKIQKGGLYLQSDMLDGIAFSLAVALDFPVFRYLDRRMKVAYSVTEKINILMRWTSDV
ncbi:hypothetical protein [Paenibacillus sp. Soil522]|uniref:hypothetical protein n=1 Tax=Paenibacillus sp. Soil522 TaxID=1736388 RepID=UPI000701DEEA|nr:hypothetical protein [Paenibacillus sp. Soil522]KRE48151.1 hypothetical protein ASG81_07465 [Paenibacillus sp. Soil522]